MRYGLPELCITKGNQYISNKNQLNSFKSIKIIFTSIFSKSNDVRETYKKLWGTLISRNKIWNNRECKMIINLSIFIIIKTECTYLRTCFLTCLDLFLPSSRPSVPRKWSESLEEKMPKNGSINKLPTK